MASVPSLTFAQALRRARLSAGLTQEELAARAGLAARSVSDLERGARRAPYRDTIERLASALQLSAAEHALLASTAGRRTHPFAPANGSGPSDAPASDQVIPPLAGRVAELAQVERLLTGTGPPLLALAGEPGIGKSRLLREASIRAEAAGWRTLSGGCQRSDRVVPYAPLVEALARHLAHQTPTQLRASLQGCAWLAPLLPELVNSTLIPVPRWTLAPAQERRLMFAAAGRYLANVAGPAGVLLTLDDLQWAGDDALDLLLALLREPAGQPLRVLCAYRSTEVQPGSPLATMLADLDREGRMAQALVGPLATDEAAALAAWLLEPDNVSAAETQRALRRAGGVPFFLVTWVRGLRVGTPGDETMGDTPWSITEQIHQRVATLPEEAQIMVGLVAVAGRDAPWRLLRAVASAAGLAAEAQVRGVEAACHAGLLVERQVDGRRGFRFTHDLIHETVLASLSGVRRGAWSLLYAEALEALPETQREREASELARYFLASDEPWRALPYTLRAGDQAEAAYAHVEAEERYRAALSLARKGGDRPREAESLERLHYALVYQSRFDAAIAIAHEASALYETLGDSEGVLRMLGRYGEMHIALAIPDRGIERLEVALRRYAAREPSHSMIICQATLAQLYFQAGRAHDALATADIALALARAMRDPAELVHARYVRGMALLGLDRVEEFAQAMEDIIAPAEQLGDLKHLIIGLLHTGASAILHGDFADAWRRLDQAADVAARLGEANLLCGVTCHRGSLAFIEGDWERADAEYARAVDCYHQVGPATWTIVALQNVVQLRQAQGRRDEARAFIEEARAGARAVNAGFRMELERFMMSALAEDELLAGRPEAARTLLEPLFEASARIDSGAPLLAWAYSDLHQESQAARTLEDFLTRAAAQGAAIATVDGLLSQAIIALHQRRWRDVTILLDGLIVRCHSLPYPYAEARALWVYGQAHTAQGEPERARQRYAAALAILNRLGERLYAERIEAALAALGDPQDG